MTQENTQQNPKLGQQQEFTPEPFSPTWDSDPVELLDIPLDFPYSAQEWNAIFEIFTDLLEHPQHHVRYEAVNKLIHALEWEETQHSNQEDYQPCPVAERMKLIFAAVTNHTAKYPDVFERFCSALKFQAREEPYHQLVLNWLDELANAAEVQVPTKDTILAAQLFFGAYDSTWQAVGATLVDLLDHADLNVRACAAYQIGLFCSRSLYRKEDVADWRYDDAKYERDKRSVIGMPPLASILKVIRSQEVARPGVAGAFWGVAPKDEFDAATWLLDVLADSPAPEPYIPYFPCNLAFYAHEWFSRDANAIRRLIDMGRADIAIMAATEESEKIAAVEPLLIELGYVNNPEIVRLASWQLAYYYHSLHPYGAELGYVELVNSSPDIDLFLLFNSNPASESPYAVVIYPKESAQPFSAIEAKRWVDRIFPESVRNDRRENLPSTDSQWYARGYVNFQRSPQNADSEFVDQIIIGYQSKQPWNPKQFL